MESYNYYDEEAEARRWAELSEYVYNGKDLSDDYDTSFDYGDNIKEPTEEMIATADDWLDTLLWVSRIKEAE